VGNDGFVQALEEMGYDTSAKNPDFVVVSLKENLLYDDLATIVELVLGGAKLVGMHETAIYAKNGRKYPGLGAILRCIEYATNTKATVIGKPSDGFYDIARKMVHAEDFSQMTIVSDDAIGDLVGAKRLGMKTILTLSGKYKKAEEILPFLADDEQPDSVVSSVAEIRFAS
jgi:NagD protein